MKDKITINKKKNTMHLEKLDVALNRLKSVTSSKKIDFSKGPKPESKIN